MNETKINSKYKTIGEVAKILNLIDKKRKTINTHYTFLGKKSLIK